MFIKRATRSYTVSATISLLKVLTAAVVMHHVHTCFPSSFPFFPIWQHHFQSFSILSELQFVPISPIINLRVCELKLIIIDYYILFVLYFIKNWTFSVFVSVLWSLTGLVLSASVTKFAFHSITEQLRQTDLQLLLIFPEPAPLPDVQSVLLKTRIPGCVRVKKVLF